RFASSSPARVPSGRRTAELRNPQASVCHTSSFEPAIVGPSKRTGRRLGQGRPADKRGRRDPVEHSPAQVLEPKISDITSERVASFSLNAPLMALVTNELSGLFTPRMVMQLWLASITTATPSVNRSCIWGRLERTSNARGIFDRPITLPLGI